jgi:hypothetical protein
MPAIFKSLMVMVPSFPLLSPGRFGCLLAISLVRQLVEGGHFVRYPDACSASATGVAAANIACCTWDKLATVGWVSVPVVQEFAKVGKGLVDVASFWYLDSFLVGGGFGKDTVQWK